MTQLFAMIKSTLEPLLAQECSPERLRAYESGESVKPLWDKIHGLGFADVALPESKGGAALRLPELGELTYLFGRYLAPLPLADTVVARALLEMSGQPMPDGLVVFATAHSARNIVTAPVVLGAVADYGLIECSEGLALLELKTRHIVPTGVSRSLAASIQVSGERLTLLDRHELPLRLIAASLRAAEMAGMLSRMLELSLDYTKERSQFGKPLSTFQAIQQQLAVFAEESAAAHMASTLAFMGPEFDLMRTAVAKMRTGAAATKAAAVAHAVHGAMGFSEEYDLQLYTRRLIENRMAEGSETYWATEIGRGRLQSPTGTSLEFVRQGLKY
jgi:acyl-CoA dehydrogenase